MASNLASSDIVLKFSEMLLCTCIMSYLVIKNSNKTLNFKFYICLFIKAILLSSESLWGSMGSLWGSMGYYGVLWGSMG